VRLIQSLCAVCGSNLAGLTLLYIVLSCAAAVVSRPEWRMLVLLIVRYVSNLINEHYYYYYYYSCSIGRRTCSSGHRLVQIIVLICFISHFLFRSLLQLLFLMLNIDAT